MQDSQRNNVLPSLLGTVDHSQNVILDIRKGLMIGVYRQALRAYRLEGVCERVSRAIHLRFLMRHAWLKRFRKLNRSDPEMTVERQSAFR
jgi:hypothetical protein